MDVSSTSWSQEGGTLHACCLLAFGCLCSVPPSSFRVSSSLVWSSWSIGIDGKGCAKKKEEQALLQSPMLHGRIGRFGET
mmetsp:Transcript_28567/g.53555  ORF Transcript_28567/g.53555 Transcript_28567/m.53555 type:complete len:80 (-) Transcript_28567:24-263(-)